MKKERLAAFVSIIRSGRATNSSTFFRLARMSKLVDGSSELQRFSMCKEEKVVQLP